MSLLLASGGAPAATIVSEDDWRPVVLVAVLAAFAPVYADESLPASAAVTVVEESGPACVVTAVSPAWIEYRPDESPLVSIKDEDPWRAQPSTQPLPVWRTDVADELPIAAAVTIVAEDDYRSAAIAAVIAYASISFAADEIAPTAAPSIVVEDDWRPTVIVTAPIACRFSAIDDSLPIAVVVTIVDEDSRTPSLIIAPGVMLAIPYADEAIATQPPTIVGDDSWIALLPVVDARFVVQQIGYPVDFDFAPAIPEGPPIVADIWSKASGVTVTTRGSSADVLANAADADVSANGAGVEVLANASSADVATHGSGVVVLASASDVTVATHGSGVEVLADASSVDVATHASGVEVLTDNSDVEVP